MTIKASQDGLEFIKKYEGFVPKAYDDAKTGKKAIGYGDTEGDTSKPITQYEAEQRLRKRVALAETELAPTVKRQLSQAQQDVLVDMHYNMGLSNMAEFIDLVNTGDDAKIQQEIIKYNKSRNVETGQMEQLDVLTRRSKDRSVMWMGQNIPQAAISQDHQDLLAGSEIMDSPNSDLLSGADQIEMAESADSPTLREQGMALASDVVDEAEVMITQEARKLSKFLNITEEEASVRLASKKSEAVIAESKRPTIAESLPATAGWAQKPENALLLEKTGNWAPRVEVAAKGLNKQQKGDWEKALSSNKVMLEQSATIGAMVLGGVSLEDGKKSLAALDIEARANQITSPGAQELNKVFSDKESSTWDMIKAMASNPIAAAQMQLQSGGSTVAIMGAGFAGAAAGTAVAPGVGTAVGGAAAAYSTSHVLSFGEHMLKQLEEFRDPITGTIDYDRAFSDPARTRKWQQEADLYGFTMGTADAAFSVLGGKIGSGVVKHVFKGKAATTAVGKAARTATNLGGQTAGKAVEEGASQTAALTAVDLYRGNLTSEKLEDNIQEGKIEGLMSTGPGATMSAVGMGVNKILNNPKASATKTVSMVNEANNANEDVAALSNLRAKVQENPASVENADQAAELVDSAVQPPPITEDMYAPIIDDVETLSESESKQIDFEADNNTISISPSEWFAYHSAQGTDPLTALTLMSPSTQAEFSRNRTSDTSVNLPISEWLRATEEDPGLESIARINGNRLNALEANEVAEDMEKEPFSLFERTVFHGSPFKFDKFKESAINSGEGAQAFGYGLYFSEDVNVAEWYRKSLTDTSMPIPVMNVIMRYDSFGFDRPGQFAAAARKNTDWANTWDAKDLPEADLKVLNDYLSQSLNQGQVFEVKLPTGLWVDLDSQLNEVPPDLLENVREALKKSVEDEKSETASWSNVDTSMKKSDYLVDFINGKTINNDFVTFGTLLSTLSAKEDKNLSVQLAAQGVNGFTYTGSESGKRNFVVFTEDDAKIVNKFYEEQGGTPTAVPENPTQINEAESADGNAILRPVELVGKFRSEGEKQVFTKFLSRLRSSTRAAKIDPRALDVVAGLQLRHMRTRSAVLGQPIEQIAERLQFTKTNKQGIGGSFTPGETSQDPYVIAFSPTATAKTVIHELGHSWLQEMAEDWEFISNIPEDQLTEVQKDYKDSMIAAASLLGLQDMGSMLTMDRGALTRIQETFASTTEDYFLKGEFANSKVKELMETFRTWMKEIFASAILVARRFPALKITPEVERIFESILGVSNKVEEEIIPMFPEPLFDPAMLGKDGQKYLETIKDARSQAVGEAYTKSFNRSLAEREKAIDAAIDQIYLESSAEIDQTPSMQVLNQFIQAYADFKAGRTSEDPRFSYESILRVIMNGNEEQMKAFKESVPRAVVTSKKKGGQDVAQFMRMSGISDPAAMRDMLVEMGSRDEMIERLATKKIDQSFPAMKSDEDIHQIAVDAVNSTGKEKLLMAELKILATKFLPALKGAAAKLINPAEAQNRISREILTEQARNIVRNTTAYKFNADKFLRDSTRHARQAARLFKTGNIIEAFDAKIREATHFFAYKAAREAQKQIANTRTRIKQIAKYSRAKDSAKKYDADVMAYARQVIQAVGSKAEIPMFTRATISPFSGVTLQQEEMINDQIEAFLLQANGRLGNDLSVGGYVQFGQVLKSIMSVARLAKEVELEGREVKLEDIANEAAADMAKSKSFSDFGAKTAGSKLRRGVTSVRSILESFYPSSEAFATSALGKLWFSVTEAEAERNLNFGRLNDRVVKAIKDNVGKDKPLAKILGPVISRFGFPAIDKNSQPIFATELGLTFSNRAEMWMAFLLMGSKSGAEKFLLGGIGGGSLSAINPITGELDTSKWDAFVARMIAEGNVTEKDFKMFQDIWDVFREVQPLVSEAMRKSDGFTMGNIEGQVVSTPWGDFQGGYVPVTVARDLMSPGATPSMLNVDTMGYRAQDMYPNMNTGMTNERTKKNGPVSLDMSRISAYLSAATNIAYLRNPLKDFGRVIESPQVLAGLETKTKGAYLKVMVPWFEAVTKQEYTKFSDNPIQTVARHLRKNVNLAMYLGGVSSVLKQGLGLLPAVKVVGVHRLAYASALSAMTPKRMREDIAAESVIMRARLTDSQERMIRSFEDLNTNFDWVNWTDEKVGKLQYFFIQMAQNQVDITVYMAAKEKGLSKGMSNDEAIRFAADTVNTTQSSPDVSAMSELQRGNDLTKLITMVTSVPLAMNNLVRVEMMRDQRAWRKASALITVGFLSVLLPNILETMFEEIAGSEEEDDEEKEQDRQDALMATLGLRILGGSIDTALPVISRPFTSTFMFGAASVSPALSKLNKFPQAYSGLGNFNKGVDLTAKELSAIMDTATIITGKPFSAIGKGVLLDEFFTAPEDLEEFQAERRIQIKEAKYDEE